MAAKVWMLALTASAVVLAAAVAGAAAWNVGASSRTILPPVNGSTDFWTPVPDDDAHSPGTLVLEWDFGRISVGNGDLTSHWVRDDIRTYAAAIEDDNGTIIIFSSTEGAPQPPPHGRGGHSIATSQHLAN